MPSPSRRVPPSPPHISRSSPSYRQRSPGHRRMGPPSRSAGVSRASPSRQRERRRSPEHASSRSKSDPRSRPRESRATVPSKRPPPPGAIDPNGRSFSAATSSKRKASPKREREMMRPLDRIESSSGSRLPPKMMRNASPEMPPVHDIPRLGPEIPPSSSRSYSHSSAIISKRHYEDAGEGVPLARSYTITAAPVAKPHYSGDTSPQRYPITSRSYAEPSSTSKTTAPRSYSGPSSFRRLPSEERTFDPTSAQKRATAHPTSSRFGDMRDTGEESLLLSDNVDMNPSKLSGYIFNIKNDPNPKFNRDQRNIVRKITNPETLQVVRRPAVPRSGGTNSYNGQQADWENQEEEFYRPLIAHRTQSSRNGEGQRPIFERDEIVHQQRTGVEEVHSRQRERSPVVQVRYVSPEPYHESRNGEPPSRSSRAIPSRSAAASTRTAYYDEEPDREYRSRGYPQDEPRESSRPVRHEDRDDLRHELEQKRVESRQSPERDSSHSFRRDGDRSRARGSGAGSDSDLRVQINEKRTTHSTERGYERERHTERNRERPMEHSRVRPTEHSRERPTEHSRERPSEHGRERARERSHERRHSPPSDRRRPSDSYERRDRSHRDTSPPSQRYHEEERLKPWEVDPEFVPRGRAYFEHDNREDMQMMRGRGHMRMRPMGLAYRGRGIRPPFRGAPFPHAGFPMSRGPPRGFPPPRGFDPYGLHRPYAVIRIRWPYVARPYAAMPVTRPALPAPMAPRPTATPTPTPTSNPALTEATNPTKKDT